VLRVVVLRVVVVVLRVALATFPPTGLPTERACEPPTAIFCLRLVTFVSARPLLLRFVVRGALSTFWVPIFFAITVLLYE
jgi:hypothetical protein